MRPTQLSFTTSIGSGNCGTTINTAGGTFINLACGGLYTGGGGNSVPLPYAVPDMGQSFTKVTACSDPTLTLSGTTPTEAGGNVCTQGAVSKRGTSCTANSDCATPCTVNGDCFSGGTVGTCLAGTCTTAVCAFEKCTNAGCLFGQPLPIPNPASTPTSVCVINVVATNASGSTDCRSGASSLSLPLTSQLYLAGDLEPNAAGIQVCPVCTKTCSAGTNNTGPCTVDADCPSGGAGSCAGSNVCHGGASYPHVPCTPQDSPVNPSFPTTQDCPPAINLSIGSLPIAFALTTGTTTLTAGNYSAAAQCTASGQPFNCCTGLGTTNNGCFQSGQNNVFCGYCRDENAKGTAAHTGCFEGDTVTNGPNCPHNSACTLGGAAPQPYRCCTGAGTGICDPNNAQCKAANTPWHCCTGAGTGTCNLNAFTPCSVGVVTVAACDDGNGSGNAGCTGSGTPQACCTGMGTGTCTENGLGAWPDCEQRDPGAFGPGGGGVLTITETGAPGGNLTDGLGHASILVSRFCIGPTFTATVDAAGDLPAPGAVALPGTAQLKP